MKEEKEKPSEDIKEEIIKDIEGESKGKGKIPEAVAEKEEEIAEEMEEASEKIEKNVEEGKKKEDGEKSKKEKSEEPKEEKTGKEETDKELLEKAEKEIEKEEKREAPKKSWRDMDEKERKRELIKAWNPKTKLGKEVKSGKVKNIDEILDNNKKILEPEIVDTLIDVKTDLIAMGQSKGKFGGGKRRAWRQTQRKTGEGNIPTFSAFAVVGDEKGHVGVGIGKSGETLPARDKAMRKAKLNIIKVVRGDGSFDSIGKGKTSIPFKVKGKAGSVRIELIPAAPGTGLVVGDELKKILKLAGIQDVYSKTFGKIRTTFNLVKACMNALEKTNPKTKNKKTGGK